MSKQTKWVVGVGVGVAVLFCSSFVFFYSRSQRRLQSNVDDVSRTTRSAFGNQLPEVHLVDSSGKKIADEILRKGKVVLVFVTADCDACHVESDFLRTIADRRSDVVFYGIISFGKRGTSQEEAIRRFPFKIFYDEGFYLAPQLGINRVPIKLYVEDGIMKKAWGGATRNEQAKAAFISWLDHV
jgi:peroxiredoxin